MIKITADSTCDLSPAVIEALDIGIVPLHVLVDGQDFLDGVDLKPADVFRYAETEGKLCKTAAVNVFEYERIFGEFSGKYDAVIHINISSDFSSCYQNARLAAQNFDNVYVVDSRNLSTGSGHLVCDAALMAKEGRSPEEIVRALEENAGKVEASFVIDKLDYLHKGGRCSGLEAFGAALLKIKPCIEVIDGKMKVGKKYRGSQDRCIENYIKERLEGRTDLDTSRVFITHSKCSDQVVEKAKEAVQRYANFSEIIVTEAGCTISSHCGPNTLGILYKHL